MMTASLRFNGIVRFLTILLSVLLLALLCAPGGTAAADTAAYTLQYNGNNSYTVTRPAAFAQLAQTVTLRPYGISALEGIHYTYASQDVSFAAGETSATVTFAIAEASPQDIAPVFRCVSDGASLCYGVEAVDEGGIRLASVVREIVYSVYGVNSGVLHNSITDLLYISGSSFASGYEETGYVDVSLPGSGYFLIADEGYMQRKFTLSLNNLYTMIPQGYLAATDARVYAAVGFTMKEEDDGYQCIQILADNANSCDGNDPLGNVDDPSVSLYKACFELSAVNNSPSVITTDSLQFFPHRYDFATRTEGSQSSTWTEFPSDYAKLFAQKFRNNCRAANTGALVLSPTVSNLYVRFDAAGRDKDDWYVKNLFARLAVCDSTRPTMTGIVVSPGPYTVGSTVSISVYFSEIVTSGDTSLSTTWGIFPEQPRDAVSNVITYSGEITGAYVGKTLQVNSVQDGTILDLAGNALSGGVSSQAFTGKTAAAAHAYSISYSGLDGAAVSPANPASYTVASPAITLTRPTRTGYTFQGWTGTGLSGLTESVTIPAGSVGDRVYTANWSPVNYTLTCTTEGPGTLEKVTGPSDLAQCHYGDVLTYSANPAGEAHLVSVTLDGVALTANDGVYSFTVPDHDMTLHAVFHSDYYNVILDTGAQFVTLTGTQSSGCFRYGSTVTLSGQTGFILRGATVDGTALTVTDGQASFLMPDHDVTISAQCAAEYLDPTQPENQQTQIAENITALNEDSTAWSGTVVAGTAFEISGRVTVTGDTRLILANSCDLDVPHGITVGNGASLTICAQSTNKNIMGSLTVTTPDTNCAGIGGSAGSEAGNITVLGGSVNVTANAYGAAIGGSSSHSSGQIAIHGGTVTAVASSGAAIGGGNRGAGTVTITGGTVTATTNSEGAAIGSGHKATGGTVNISGGTVTATANNKGAAIGSGAEATGCAVNISGGTVSATARNIDGESGAGIGSGYGGNATVTLTWDEDAQGTPVPCAITANTYSDGVTLEKSFLRQAANDVTRKISGGDGYGGADLNGTTLTPFVPGTFSLTLAAGHGGGTLTDSDGSDSTQAQTGEEVTVTLLPDAGWTPREVLLSYAGSSVTHTLPLTDNAVTFSMPHADTTVTAVYSVSYFDPTKPQSQQTQTVDTFTELADDSNTWSGTVVACGKITMNSRVTVSGDTRLILADGCVLAVPSGITVGSRDSLTICGQGAGTGSLTVTTPGDYCAGIGGGDYSDAGDITILGGSVTTVGKGGAAIGGGYRGAGTVMICGGTVSATASGAGAAIGSGYLASATYTTSSNTVNISGGRVSAVTNGAGAAIGSGDSAKGCTVNISGGTVSAVANGTGAAIGSGYCGSAAVTISGGTISATANGYGPAIGRASYGSADVTLTWDEDAQGAPVSCAITANTYWGNVTLAKDFAGRAADGSRCMLLGDPDAYRSPEDLNGKTLTPYVPVTSGLTLVSEHGTAALKNSAGDEITQAASFEEVTLTVWPEGCWEAATATLTYGDELSETLTLTDGAGTFLMPVGDTTVTVNYTANHAEAAFTPAAQSALESFTYTTLSISGTAVSWITVDVTPEDYQNLRYTLYTLRFDQPVRWTLDGTGSVSLDSHGVGCYTYEMRLDAGDTVSFDVLDPEDLVTLTFLDSDNATVLKTMAVLRDDTAYPYWEAREGWRLDGWLLDGQLYGRNDLLTASQDLTLVAQWTQLFRYQITTSPGVAVMPASGDTPVTAAYEDETLRVTVTDPTYVPAGRYVSGFTVDGEAIASGFFDMPNHDVEVGCILADQTAVSVDLVGLTAGNSVSVPRDYLDALRPYMTQSTSTGNIFGSIGRKIYIYYYDIDGNGTDDLRCVMDITSYISTEITLSLLSGVAEMTGNAVTASWDSPWIITWRVFPDFGTPTFVLPAGTTGIGEEAFSGITAGVVDIPDTCLSIGDRAFRGCTGLTQIRIPADCALGQDVFDGCARVLVFGYAGSPAETYCLQHDNCVFIRLSQD